MIEFIDIRPEDGIKKLRVSCSTLRAIISEAYLTENENKDDGYRTHAGIAHWVRVPVCECGACASLLADSKRAGRKMLPGHQALPIINCQTAIRLKDKAGRMSEPVEEERLLDIAEGSLVIHQCGNPRECGIHAKWKFPENTNGEATKAMELYQLFQQKVPKAAMEVTTYSGSVYTLRCKDGKVWVTRDHEGEESATEELRLFARLRDRMLINDWFTSSAVGSRMIFAIEDDRDREREKGLVEELRDRSKDHPPWELVLDDIEQSIDNLEKALDEQVA